jgi:arsenite methyltransferase
MKKKAFKEQYAQIRAQRQGRLDDHKGGDSAQRAKTMGYSEDEIKGVPEEAIQMGLGCGNPTAIAELHEGQTVLDLGSGAGLDAFLAARKVGPRGKVIGVDMTPEMVEKANGLATKSGYSNVEFRLGEIEHLPVADESIDVIISNCVINHTTEKLTAFTDALRVLRPGGRICVSDLVVEGQPPPADAPGLEVWAEWLTAACGKKEYLGAMGQAGFKDIDVVTEYPYSGPGMVPQLAGKIVGLQLKAVK